MKTIELRTLTQLTIERLEKLTAKELEDFYRNGDFLYMDGVVFSMVYYSLESLPNSSQSKEVSYWAELYDLEINLDFLSNTVSVDKPVSDWRRMGF